jgi:hypothetical protein
LDKIQQSRLTKSDSNPLDKASFTGNTSPTLRTMVDVCSKCLEEGHTFPDQDIVLLRVAEEANLFGITLSQARAMSKSCTALVRILLSMPPTQKVAGGQLQWSE